MAYQNYRGDFTRIETFYRTDGTGQKEQIPVPEHVRVEYFTKGCSDRYVAERNGEICDGCVVSEDGMSLTVNIPLSRQPIGEGEMFVLVTEFVPDDNFPDGVRSVPVPGPTGVILWHGASDNSLESRGSEILMPFMYGYSAYDLWLKDGNEGTVDDFLAWLRQPAVDAAEKVQFATIPQFVPMKSSSYHTDYKRDTTLWVRSYNLCLRFRGAAPPADWKVEYYMFNNVHSRTQWKFIGSDAISDFTEPNKPTEGKEERYSFLVSPRSLVDLFHHKFVPEGDRPESSTSTSYRLSLWSAVLNSTNKTKGAWMYGDSKVIPLVYERYPRGADLHAVRYSGNFGIRIVSSDDKIIGDMIPFTISIRKTAASYNDVKYNFHTFTLKSHIGMR